MNVRETAFLFDCEGESLPGIIATPAGAAAAVGVLVVVGGPQYRVGSHRQFVLLARHLAAHGVACMRFDYRGMGDGGGEARSFDALQADLRAAVDAFFARQPGVSQVVLWGLCDGASAACLQAPLDARIAGLVLLNPWVRTEGGEARTRLRHYYLKRIADPAFWRKLLGGGVALGRSLGGVVGAARTATSAAGGGGGADLPARMVAGLAGGGAKYVFILSTRDYVAREFEDAAARSPDWQRALAAASPPGVRRVEADHTFSNAAARNEVAELTLEWVRALGAREGGEA